VTKRTESSRFLQLITVLLCWTLLTSEVLANDLERRIHTSTLQNGLKILIVQRHLSPTVSCYIRHRAGSVDEPEGLGGLAHFLEHMMFKGTKTLGTRNYAQEKKIMENIRRTGRSLDTERRKEKHADRNRIRTLSLRLGNLQKRQKQLIVENEIDRLYRENGGVNLNATTGQDLTSYHVSLPANRIELWARIESDRIRHAVFREFYTERDVIMEERRQRIESDPEGMLYERFLAEAFTVHPYRRPVLGFPDDQRYLDMAAMRSFYRKYHAPNNTVIAIVGDIDTETVMRLIRKYFSTIPRQRNDRPLIIPEPPQRNERRIDVTYDARPLIAIGYHKPAPPAFDDYVFDVIDCLLTNGRSSRLYGELIDRRQIAESVSTHNGIPASRYANLFTIWTAPREPCSPSELETAVYKELEILKREPVTAKEMERVRNQIRSEWIRYLDSNESLAAILSHYVALMGDHRYFTTYLNTIEKVTPADIMRVAGQYLRAENRTVATLTRSKEPVLPSFSQPPCPDTHGNQQGKGTQDDNR